jgi:hypothetical protein
VYAPELLADTPEARPASGAASRNYSIALASDVGVEDHPAGGESAVLSRGERAEPPVERDRGAVADDERRSEDAAELHGCHGVDSKHEPVRGGLRSEQVRPSPST